ncbi:MAG TPA: hypothetical protein VFA36_03110, partial [Burkholderiales bacterium]|nr:hypothetical protein [Burkholderiales bacterium]
MKKSLIAVIAALLPLCTATVQAGSLVDLAVVDRTTGERIPVYSHRGRLYVPGTPGQKYSLLVTNKTGARVLTVASVDGVNVITGETAAPSQSGYVLGSWGSVSIAGWRKSMSEVAAFFFTPLPDSYAARTDRPGNVGVIGVAVFREYQPPRPPAALMQQAPSADSARREAESSADAVPRAAPRPEDKLGTGHGERETSEVTWTDFRRASEVPSELISIYYDSRA